MLLHNQSLQTHSFNFLMSRRALRSICSTAPIEARTAVGSADLVKRLPCRCTICQPLSFCVERGHGLSARTARSGSESHAGAVTHRPQTDSCAKTGRVRRVQGPLTPGKRRRPPGLFGQRTSGCCWMCNANDSKRVLIVQIKTEKPRKECLVYFFPVL